MPEIPEPTVTVAGYRVSCLPPDHPDARHFTITVTYRTRGDESGFVVRDAGIYFDRDGLFTDEPVLMPEAEALALAKEIAPIMVVSGSTVTDVLARDAEQRVEIDLEDGGAQ